MNFYNLEDNGIYRRAGAATISPGGTLLLNTDGSSATLQIVAEGQSYQVTDTGLDESTILDQSDSETEGWNSVNGDQLATGSDSLQWDGILTAIKIQASSENTEDITVAWRLENE